MQNGMHHERERCVRAVQSKDARFDGWFFTAVLTTRIYCRPSCPVVPPKPENMTFHPSAAACQQAGFRACKRCRPDTSPGSPEWNQRADLVARAMRLVIDGVVDREGVPGLAARLGYSTRQVERQLLAELGAGPLALARAQRAQTARLLIETTPLPMAEVAFAAGFSSVRGFNDTVREVFALSPSELRARVPRKNALSASGAFAPAASGGLAPAAAGALALRLPFRAPLNPDNLFGHLVATAVPGVEEWRDMRRAGGADRPDKGAVRAEAGEMAEAGDGWAYRRTLRLPNGHGIVALTPQPDHIACRLALSDLRDLTVAISRCRRMLDLDADPVAVDDHLRTDPVLAPLVDKAPGRRVPRTVDEAEFAMRAVLGQQVSTAAARTHAARLVTAYGDPVDDPEGGLTRLFPTPEALAALDPESLAMPRTRRTTFTTLVGQLADGTLNLGVESDWTQTRAQLLALPGFGPWTADVIAMRALGDPDAFLPTDLGIRRAAQELGLPSTPAALTARAAAWRPWRAYAVQYLWATDSHPINFLPTQGVS
ncbi:AraC family transcriptional regulator of adaptative response / DNA-3-methyladenine glycosylase II [Streptomyces sp. LBL]|uniref:AlkA N-terminal domain-containing protein n=1 Tax=Streptomyces sp. LBL TaxID=2940562 RepID=UPI002473FE20|nr:AlkA N-terminal domain-containing protein [Streptomyces sp. LBL]MDH6624626.1 AraC family transcriptional regulator of adaptative response / DNA-3-methyladenine glycosylase II [Streptomyces sp. LBL]